MGGGGWAHGWRMGARTWMDSLVTSVAAIHPILSVPAHTRIDTHTHARALSHASLPRSPLQQAPSDQPAHSPRTEPTAAYLSRMWPRSNPNQKLGR